jgi:WD40 repeat protein
VLPAGPGGIYAVALSPDGQRIAVTYSIGTVQVSRVDGTGVPVVILGHGVGSSAVWSPDGRSVMTPFADDTARMWDSTTGAEVAVLRHGIGPGLRAIAFSPDGVHVLTASEAGTVRVWTADGRPVAPRAEHSEASLAGLREWDQAPSSRMQIYRSNDWRHLLAAFPADPNAVPTIAVRGEVAFAEVPQDPQALLVTGVPGPVTATGTANGRLLVGTHAGEVYRWSPTGGAVKAESAHSRPITSFAAGLATTLSVADDGTGRLWDSEGESSTPLAIELIASSAVSLDRGALMVATRTGEVHTIDARPAAAALARAPRRLANMTWSTTVDALASRSSDDLALISSGAVHVCEKADEWACHLVGGVYTFQLLAAGPVRGALAATSQAYVPTTGVLSASLGDPAQGAAFIPASRFKGPIGWPVALRYSPDGTRVAIASTDGTVWLARADGEGCPLVLRHETPLADIAFSPDGSLLVTGSFDGDVRVFSRGRRRWAGATHGPPRPGELGRLPAGRRRPTHRLGLRRRQRALVGRPRGPGVRRGGPGRAPVCRH